MRSGLAVSLDALQLLWRLEDDGMVVRLDGERLQVGPTDRLTDSDDEAIRQHRNELVALVRMVDEVVA